MGSRIRVATPADAPAVRAIYAPVVEETPISFELDPPSVETVRERIASTMPEYPWLVCEVDGTVVGYAAAGSLRGRGAYRWTVELSVYVAADARGEGVGTELYSSLLAILERQGYCNAYAVTTLPNPASTTLHERLGFEPVGTFPGVGYKQGSWHDVRWWHRALRDRPADPDPPTPLSALREDSQLADALASGETRAG